MQSLNLKLSEIFTNNNVRLEKSGGKSKGSKIDCNKIFLSTLHAKKLSSLIGDGFNSEEYKNAFVSIKRDVKVQICNRVIYKQRHEEGESISITAISNKNTTRILGKGTIGSVLLWEGSDIDLLDFFKRK